MIIAGGLLALPDEHEPVRADLHVGGGRIVRVERTSGTSARRDDAEEVVDARGCLVLPGAIDPHVHFDDPGYTEREDFAHGSAAAASGGVTTVIDMPSTSVPPITSRAHLLMKLAAIEGEAVIDYGLFGGVSAQVLDDDPEARIAELAPDVLGFKSYFVSGMETFARVDHRRFLDVLRMTAAVDRPTLLHAEEFDFVTGATAAARSLPDGPRAWYESRPEEAEVLAVLAACELAERAGGDLHVVHVSTGRAAAVIAATPGVTGETAPHYLAFSLDDFERLGSALKVAPPVKPQPNAELLWQALGDGSLSFVASDHAPAPTAQKRTGSIWTDYAGIPGSGTLLPYLYSEGYRSRRLRLGELTALTARNAARRYGIDDRKGALTPGLDADCVIVREDADWTVRGEAFLSKGRVTPFEGMSLRGRVEKTLVRGTVVFDNRHGIMVDGGYGHLVRRAR